MDVQALVVAATGMFAAIGAVMGGVYTGRNSRRVDESKAKLDMENSRFAREQAEEIAARVRIEEIAEDASQVRKRLREVEDEFEKQLRECHRNGRRGWDLAWRHFSLVSFLAHLLNNLITIHSMGGSPDSLYSAVGNAAERMKIVKLPITLEDPILDGKADNA